MGSISLDKYNSKSVGIYATYNDLHQFQIMLLNHLGLYINKVNNISNENDIIPEKLNLTNDDILDNLLLDVKNYYAIVKTEGLEDHIKFTYLEKNSQQVKDFMFNKLWEYTFIDKQDKYADDRIINLFVMRCLVRENKQHYLTMVLADPDIYSEINLSAQKIEYTAYNGHDVSSPISALIHFLSEFDEFYPALNKHAMNIIAVETQRNIYYQIRGTFLSQNIKKHTEMIAKKINAICSSGNGYYWAQGYDILYSSDCEFLMEKAKEKNCVIDIQEYFINYFLDSPSYDGATAIFKKIKPYIKEFSKVQIERLLEGMKQNSQIRDNFDYNSMRYYVENIKETL